MTLLDVSILRIYINGDDLWHGNPLYRALVEKARALDLAGASVFAVESGYGSHRTLHDVTSEYRFVSSPLLVELIDIPERIDRFLAEAALMISEGLSVVTTGRALELGAGGPTNPIGE